MSQIVAALADIVGSRHVLDAATVRARTVMWQTHQPCQAAAVVRPATTAELSAVLAACHAAGQSVVPYGGLTNLVQGALTTPDDIAISLERMNAIEETDPVARTMTAQAGVTMRAAQEAADEAGLFFPVDIGARDACAVGGFVATNAGGTKVIRYGMTRDAVLGLEAVLADGTVISSMNRYIKNNSGFDLKQLFIGTEGLLGIITRVIFRLSSRPSTHNVALVAAENYADVVAVLNRARDTIGDSLSGFEVMWDSFFRRAVRPVGPHASPFDTGYPVYVIVEAMGNQPQTDDDSFEKALVAMLEEGLIADAVIAKSDAERGAIWDIRGEVEWLVTAAQNFDVSLRSVDVDGYIDSINAAIRANYPDAEIAAFGHLGDNNLHVSIIAHSDDPAAPAFVEQCVYESLRPFQGAVSAEHGIGIERKQYLDISRTADEIALMRTLKSTLDPHNILNPGKVIG